MRLRNVFHLASRNLSFDNSRATAQLEFEEEFSTNSLIQETAGAARARGENRLGAGNVRPRPFSVHVFVTCQTENSELSLVQLRQIEAPKLQGC